MKITKEQTRRVLICCGVLLGALILILLLDVACVVRLVFGVPCPGCGMTRAHLAALRLDFASAFYWHPLWMLPIPLVLFSCLWPEGITSHRKAQQALLIALTLLVIGVYVWRMVTMFPATPPMDFYRQSLLWRLIRHIS